MNGALIFRILREIPLYPEEFLDLRYLITLFSFIGRRIMPLNCWEGIFEIIQII
jgi:hypothetical protein